MGFFDVMVLHDSRAAFAKQAFTKTCVYSPVHRDRYYDIRILVEKTVWRRDIHHLVQSTQFMATRSPFAGKETLQIWYSIAIWLGGDGGLLTTVCSCVDGWRDSGVYSLWRLPATVHLEYDSENSARKLHVIPY